MHRSSSYGSTTDISTQPNSPLEVSQSEAKLMTESPQSSPILSSQQVPRPLTLVSSQTAADAKVMLGSWGSGVGTFFSSRASRFSLGSTKLSESKPTTPAEAISPNPLPEHHDSHNDTNSQPRGLNTDGRSLTEETGVAL
jgi:hypothetical protein